MIIDINDGFWVDSPEGDLVISTFLLGFTNQAVIITTEFAKECKFSITEYESRRYISIFEGCGITFSDIQESYDTNFEDVPPPLPHPIIGLDNDINKLKSLTIRYIEEVYQAVKPGRKDWENRMKEQDKVLTKLVDGFYKMFSIKQELN